MSGKRVKRLRRQVRKEATNIRKDYIKHLKKMDMAARLKAAWQIIGGRRWQGELFRLFCFAVLILAGYGLHCLTKAIPWRDLLDKFLSML